jgi:hypothetical protein
MSFLNATLWNDIQVSDATNEKRFAQLGVVDLVKDSSAGIEEYIPPSVREAMATLSSQRGQQIPVLKDQVVEVNQSPGFPNIPTNLAETDRYGFEAFDVFSGFRYFPAAHANNQVDGEWYRRNVMMNVAYEMAKKIEELTLTVLEARKTQVLNYTTQVSQGDGSYSFNNSTDVLSISKAAQKETMFFNLTTLMEANEVGGEYRIVNNRGGLSVQKAEQLKYTVANEKNLAALGMFPMSNMYETASIDPGSNVFNGFLVRNGAIGYVENYPHDFVMGTTVSGKEWRVSDVELPFVRMRCNIYTNTEATDATALIQPVNGKTDSNLVMTTFQEMAIWCRFYIVYRYNSSLSTRVNDIVKIAGLTS